MSLPNMWLKTPFLCFCAYPLSPCSQFVARLGFNFASDSCNHFRSPHPSFKNSVCLTYSIHLSIPGKEARGSTAADEQVTSFPRTHQVDLSPWLCNLTALYFAHLLQTAIRLVANRLSEHVRYNIRLQSVPSRWQSRRRDVRNRDLIYGLPFAAPACCCMTCIMLRSCWRNTKSSFCADFKFHTTGIECACENVYTDVRARDRVSTWGVEVMPDWST